MILYSVKDGENVINKNMVEIATVDITLRGELELLNPVIIFKRVPSFDIFDCNYCYFEEFNRYYFIRKISVSGDVYFLHLEVDVLDSYKDDILNSDSVYKSAIEKGDYTPITGGMDTKYDNMVVFSDRECELDESMLLITIGNRYE